ncbi:MAG: hypothetical protein CMH60_02930 [Myxococcales bacterium]|nr:hypothetical protein [Myxococcales bacterium]
MSQDIVDRFRKEFDANGLSTETLDQGLRAFLGDKALELGEFASLARLIGGAFGAVPVSPKTRDVASVPKDILLSCRPEGESLLPKRHEFYEQTHLLKLVLRLDTAELPAVNTFSLDVWRSLPGDEKERVRGEQAVLFALAKYARVLLPELKQKVSGDAAMLLRLTDYLPKEWRLYYHTVVDAGLRSLIQGMGIGGYTEDNALFEEEIAGQEVEAAERERLASPLVAMLVCLFLRYAEENPLKQVMRALTLYQNRYGLSFSGIPGRGNITFPEGGAPPEGILEEKRVCTGVAYVEALCLYALNSFKRRHLLSEH